jgi:foldase protein PrsA
MGFQYLVPHPSFVWLFSVILVVLSVLELTPRVKPSPMGNIYLYPGPLDRGRVQTLADKIKCSHILVKKQSEAILILERLKKGESFTNLAKELSIDKGSAKKGGDLGLFGRGMMVKPFEEAAFKLNKGEVTSEPVKTEFGYHIIKRAG